MSLPERGLRWSIRALEWVSRRIRGVEEFGDDPEVIFRLGIGRAGRVINLSDGNTLQPEDAVGELHLWNEHLLLGEAHRPNLLWAVAIRRRMTESLHDLATYLVADHRFDEIKALRIQPASVDGHREATLHRILAHYGFEADREANTNPPPSWLYRYGDNFWLWMLAWTFNPTRSREDWRFDRRRIDFWISRSRFIALYRSSAQNALNASQVPDEPHKA